MVVSVPSLYKVRIFSKDSCYIDIYKYSCFLPIRWQYWKRPMRYHKIFLCLESEVIVDKCRACDCLATSPMWPGNPSPPIWFDQLRSEPGESSVSNGLIVLGEDSNGQFNWKPRVVMMPTFVFTGGNRGCHNDNLQCHYFKLRCLHVNSQVLVE